ncbi:hypothetical protein ACFSUS_13315 [Spirosoma soli]|uniref:Sigma-70 family RNA polymerase sigma factor n=1 Tax=Spirosoma soli TaxID=1770529 RepID=A0ABW5M5X7_9BACT
MNKLERFGAKSASQGVMPGVDRIALYDQYGSMAYGIILRILRQPEIAQQVLVDLFASPELASSGDFIKNPAVTIIRLARQKALDVQSPTVKETPPSFQEKEKLSDLIFDLSFRQGYTPEAVAQQLQISYTDVMQAIRDHFAYLRNAKRS